MHCVNMSLQHLFVAAIYSLLLLLLLCFPADSNPIVTDCPFAIFWNAPSHPCLTNYGVMIDLAAFGFVINHNHSFLGPELVIFYSTQLGLYPYYNQEREPVNGGLPQNASLEDHLIKVYNDLKAVTVDNNFKGLAVVDWEHWRPLWDRNWEKMLLYQQRSLQLISQRHPYWSFRSVRRVAKRQFEAAAQEFMSNTLQLGRKLSPRGLWGFYGFPECYNFDYKNSSKHYTGKCPENEVQRNDAITWLWRVSRALYPNIYLEKYLKNSEYVGPFVRYRLGEGFRVSNVSSEGELPVLPYARIVYTYSMDFLTQEDLIQTIGQSAALGAAGVILWGNADYSSSKESCLAVKSYLDETLGRYVKNVTTGALLCSQTQCSGNGRCVRENSADEVYLHLDPEVFSITQHPLGTGFVVQEKPHMKNLNQLWPQFQCRCYKGWKGSDCSQDMH